MIRRTGTGTPRTEGANGAQGPDGPRTTDGAHGSDGGSPGVDGPQGTDGPEGADGPQDADGPEGADGPQDADGPEGADSGDNPRTTHPDPQPSPAPNPPHTPNPLRNAVDAEDLDVDEVLALVNGDRRARSAAPTASAGTPGAPGRGGRAASGSPAAGRPAAGDSGTAAHGTAPRAAALGAPVTEPAVDRHRASTSWPEARARAERAAPAGGPGGRGRRSPVSVPLDAALGLALAAPLPALTDLPSFDTSAMDGWAVSGPGPWTVREEGVLAGHAEPRPLGDGEAVRIATGARVPAETTAVLRSEHGRVDAQGRLHAVRETRHGQDIRPRGQECRSGDPLLSAGTVVTPAALGLAAAAGYDTLTVVPRPRVEVLILGDELLTEGLPREGLIRDALGPMLPPWLRALGAEVTAVRRLGDDAKALLRAVRSSKADVIVTTGGTASGPVDHVHPMLEQVGAELLVDGVRVRPGHPMLLARLEEGRHLVGLPGNPLAAVSGLLTLAEPLLRTLAARPAPEPYALPAREDVQGHPRDTRLVPVALRGEHAVPLRWNGPAMLRGIAGADAMGVVPPGGVRAGQELELLDLPWAVGGIEVCFT